MRQQMIEHFGDFLLRSGERRYRQPIGIRLANNLSQVRFGWRDQCHNSAVDQLRHRPMHVIGHRRRCNRQLDRGTITPPAWLIASTARRTPRKNSASAELRWSRATTPSFSGGLRQSETGQQQGSDEHGVLGFGAAVA